MDGTQLPDPFLWDVETLAHELCGLSRPCTRDPDDLAALLQKNEIDGHTLLTYDLVGCITSHELRNELFQILNVQLARHRNALGEAIMQLRAKSSRFRQWKLDNLERPSLRDHDERDVRGGGREGTYSARMTPHSEPSALLALPNNNKTNDFLSSTPPLGNPLNPGSFLQTPVLSTAGEDGEPAIDGPTMETSSFPDAMVDSPIKQLKRKRVVPELIQSDPLHHLPIPIPTEADILDHNSSGQDGTFTWDIDDAFAYLGAGSLSKRDVVSHKGSITHQIQGEGDTLYTTGFTQFAPGRRLAVYKMMKRVLVENGRTIAMVDAGIYTDTLRQPTSGDDVLDLDDLPEDVDEETLKEMEAERAEKADATRLPKRLSPDRVRQLLDEEISVMSKTWAERKMPKYQNKAYALWLNATKKGDKLNGFLEARDRVKFYGERLQRLEGEIVEQVWEKEKEVRFQARLLEQNIEDKLYQCWRADILESRVPPPKPLPLPRRSVTKEKKAKAEFSDEERLTSSDEEMFIVEDEQPAGPNTPAQKTQRTKSVNLNRPPSPMQVDSPIFIDLTQTPSTRASSPIKWPIKASGRADLVTPIKVRPDDSVVIKEEPSIDEATRHLLKSSWAEKYQDIDKITSLPINHWTKVKERFALTICLLRKLNHSRRSAIFKHIQECDVQSSFKLTILRHISNPLKDLDRLDSPSPESLAFDLTRLFLCFLKTKNLKETRLADLKASQIAKLKAKENHSSWNVFHAFISEIAPFFPQDNQIYTEKASDDEPLGDDVSDVEESLGSLSRSKTPRKTIAKEIVRNKEAVDLREREISRQAEQETRRRRLRANLGGNVLMSPNKSRLIINESKQDDQPFIYINDEIGSRIKDHQIEGVRFMWNQILQDLELRQGCLLSHSMGLGKTMQVITLLVAIQESSKSSDPGAVSQIPEDLRKSKTLVACPPSLVNNWMDELLIWDKDLILGDLHAIDASLSPEERFSTAQRWSRDGGVLIIGYSMLRQIVDNDEEERWPLFGEPNIVIADEAHMFKNPASKLHLACSRFQTSSRIAMTGSPLANNIEEYYFMINWVAQNFLGPLEEFRQIYSNPIQHGLEVGSSGAEKRRALKTLAALKQIVAPKVHRATIKSVMDKDLPPKKEFVICVKPKPLQIKLYNLYAQLSRGESVGEVAGEVESQGQIFRLLGDLGLICNHPYTFYGKAHESHGGPPDGKAKFGTGLRNRMAPAVIDAFTGIQPDYPFLSAKVELLVQILDHARKLKEKVLVFSQSIPTLNYLSKLFEGQKRHFSRLDGQTPIQHRQDQIKKFNANQMEVYLISTKAGGVGLNIQGANKVVIFDFGWNPVNEQQAIGRSYRIGQTKPVSVYHLVTAGTFEQDLHERAVFKTQLATRVVDKKNPISWGKRITEVKHDIKEIKKESLTQFENQDPILDKLIKYNSGHDVIRKIMSTETFEEEDTKAPLSAEEQKEANDMAALNRIRLTDPEEYRRRQWGQDDRDHSREVSHPTHAPSLTMDIRTVPDLGRTLDGAADGDTLVRSNSRPQTLKQPRMLPFEAVWRDTAPASWSNGIRAGRRNTTTDLPPPQLPPPPPGNASEVGFQPRGVSFQLRPSPGKTLPRSALVPIPGADTYFGKTATQSLEPKAQEASITKSPQSKSPGSTTQISANPFASQINNVGKTEFKQKLSKKLEAMPDDAFASLVMPRLEIVDQLIDSIDATRREHKFGFLPDNQHWRALGNLIEQDRFVLAVMTRQLEPSYLALTDANEVEKYMGTLNKMSSTDIANQAQSQRQDNAGGQATNAVN